MSWGCLPPVPLPSFFSASFSIYVGDKRVTRSLPVRTACAVKAKLVVDPGDLRGPRSRKFNLYMKCAKPAICLDL